MMRKFSVLFFLVLFSVAYVHAQSTTSTSAPANPGGFIIKGGVNFSNISTQNDGGYSDANTLTTFNVGVLVDIPLADVLSLQPGVVLTGKGSKASGSVLGVNYGLGLSKIFPNQDDNDANDKNKYRVFSINVGVRF